MAETIQKTKATAERATEEVVEDTTSSSTTSADLVAESDELLDEIDDLIDEVESTEYSATEYDAYYSPCGCGSAGSGF